MLTSNEENVMIKHILDRRSKHLDKLYEEDSSHEKIEIWQRFYNKLLVKYNCCEVKNYVWFYTWLSRGFIYF